MTRSTGEEACIFTGFRKLARNLSVRLQSLTRLDCLGFGVLCESDPGLARGFNIDMHITDEALGRIRFEFSWE